jgi:hypothetical protein
MRTMAGLLSRGHIEKSKYSLDLSLLEGAPPLAAQRPLAREAPLARPKEP